MLDQMPYFQHKRKQRAHKCCGSRAAETDARIIFDDPAMRFRSIASLSGKHVGLVRIQVPVTKVDAAGTLELKLSDVAVLTVLIWVPGDAPKLSRRLRMRQV